ncbi:unnamed protein product [Cylindrotheca closterium]|uniref:Methyltransferase type 11 domain-containing protein n=1 Tax=Cylindrotheca closterium TaxID=2856 RepID=A0AAD2PWR0_9STRA|nr:unnamed protein product [Cylindrotheca closterium]
MIIQLILVCSLFYSWLSQTASAWTINRYLFSGRRITSLSSAAFDFSSPAEWDKFYQTEEETNQEHVEWHSSIPLETIASYVTPDSKCLIPGCGNSRLPDVLLASVPGIRISLQDSSTICMSQMEKKYGSSIEGYYCGDATKLQDQFPSMEEKFDTILDKGLSDALFCNEAWDYWISSLLRGACKILKEETGIYLLISYKLPKSTQEFLQELGAEIGLEWTFDVLEYSNNRVGLSMAKKA